MLQFLRKPPGAEPLTEGRIINATYSYWRVNILISIWAGYGFYYLTRNSLTANIPGIIHSGLISHESTGVILTLFYIVYGTSKFFSGMVSDLLNNRYIIGFGLIATGIINILAGLSYSMLTLVSLWALNAFFQSWGAPSCTRMLTVWYSRTERGGWWALWNTSHNVGGAITPVIIGIVSENYGWRMGMFVPGALAILLGMYLCWQLRDRPQVIGLPAVCDWKCDALDMTQQRVGTGMSHGAILVKYVLTNPYIWLLSASYMLIYLVRAAIGDWGGLYMSEFMGTGLAKANSAVTIFEFGGLFGALVAGWGSDKLFNGNRGPVNLIFCAGLVLSVASLWLMPKTNFLLQSAGFFITGFFVFGPQMLIGMAAVECSHKDVAGAATGFIGFFAYIGASTAGWPLSKAIESWHWTGFFCVLSCAALAAVLLLLPFLRVQSSSAEN